jgi:ATP-binding cassette subfamily F protein uup
MTQLLLQLTDIRVNNGAAPLLAGAQMVVNSGERLCVVGRNGCGKSTLLRIAAGLLGFDGGSRFVQPGTTIRYLPQEPDLAGFATTAAYVAAGLGPGDDPHRVAALLDALALVPAADPAQLSGGEARRAALARVLAPAPDILLLDEPTNHLDLPAITWLEAELGASRAALVLVSHDRRLLERVARSVLWLDRGITRRLDRGFAAFDAWRDALLAEERREAHKRARRLAAEEDWLRYGVTARRKRNVRRLQALQALRQRHRAAQPLPGTVRLAAAESPGGGRIVLEARGVEKSFAGRLIVRGLDLRLLRGDRLALVGPNGAGKTTLLRLLCGRLVPDRGSVQRADGLQIAFLEQGRENLDPARTLADTLSDGHGEKVVVNGEARHVVGVMKDFLFDPARARAPVGTLSGGERARLALAIGLLRPSNLLVLDEPTNDLDLETLELLQELLADYAGTVLLVSHDRDFLDRVATSVLNAEGDGRWVDYAGGFSDMLAQGGRVGVASAAAGAAAASPPRPRPPPPPPPGAAPRKLSFKDRHALAVLPRQIEALTAEVADCRRALADPDLYRRDRAAYEDAADRLRRSAAELAAAEERWLALELLRERLEGR